MDNIVLDESGRLESGIFYEFGVPLGDELPITFEPEDQAVLSKRTPTDDELIGTGRNYLWVDLAVDEEGRFGPTEIVRKCPRDDTHDPQWHAKELTVDLLGGPRVADFVHLEPDQVDFIVSEAFGERLKASGLIGFGLAPVKIGYGHPSYGKPKLKLLQLRGRKCLRPLTVRGASNQCPFCGREPLICPACGQWLDPCPKCGEIGTVVRQMHKGTQDKRLIIAERGKPIVEGKNWDGSDLIFGQGDGRMITKRALDWLLSVHAAPFYARPIRVCVDGMSEKQLRQLEAAKNVASLKQK